MAALDAIADARVYDLAQPLEAATPVLPHHAPFRMALLRRHGDYLRDDGSSGANELLSLGGHTGTHIDALCHQAEHLSLCGGVSADPQVQTSRGFTQHGVEEIARRKKCTPSQLALAWVAAQGDDIVPLFGTKRRKYLDENLAALDVEITPADLEEIDEVAPKGVAAGERYAPGGMKTING